MGLYSKNNNRINGTTITNSDISSGNHFVSGRVYSSLGQSINASAILVADTTYCTPYYGIDPITAATSIAIRVTTAGTSSNLKFGIATMSGTTATMITTLNPTGVATNTPNTTVSGSFGAVNIKGHQFYLLCVIGAGTVMPTVNTSSSTNLITWAVGAAASDFGPSVYTGWTSAANTYAGGFNSTFTLTPTTSTTMPLMGIVAP